MPVINCFCLHRWIIIVICWSTFIRFQRFCLMTYRIWKLKYRKRYRLGQVSRGGYSGHQKLAPKSDEVWAICCRQWRRQRWATVSTGPPQKFSGLRMAHPYMVWTKIYLQQNCIAVEIHFYTHWNQSNHRCRTWTR